VTSIFRGFAFRLARAASADTYVPERIDDEEYRHCQVEDNGGQRQEDAYDGGASPSSIADRRSLAKVCSSSSAMSSAAMPGVRAACLSMR
jgi:hypothetical protein